MFNRRILGSITFLLLFSAIGAAAWQAAITPGPPGAAGSSQPNAPQPLRPDPAVSDPLNDQRRVSGTYSGVLPPDMLAKMAEQRNRERIDSLKKDTEKMLALATELKELVEKSGTAALSLDALRKSEEMEKLAKQVRKKMKE